MYDRRTVLRLAVAAPFAAALPVPEGLMPAHTVATSEQAALDLYARYATMTAREIERRAGHIMAAVSGLMSRADSELTRARLAAVMANVGSLRARSFALAGDTDGARLLLDNARQSARFSGDMAAGGQVGLWAALVELWAGNPDGALSHAEMAGYALAGTSGEPYALSIQARAYAVRGDTPHAEDRLVHSRALLDGYGVRAFEPHTPGRACRLFVDADAVEVFSLLGKATWADRTAGEILSTADRVDYNRRAIRTSLAAALARTEPDRGAHLIRQALDTLPAGQRLAPEYLRRAVRFVAAAPAGHRGAADIAERLAA